jgi:antirestriction protein
MEKNMKICIQNLGMYTEGVLLWHWLELPATDAEIQEALDKIRICNDKNQYYNEAGCPYEEYHIADVEDFPFDYSEYWNIEELNELAELYENLSETEQEAFEYFNNNGYSEKDALEKASDHDYYYIEANNDTELAERYIDEVYGSVGNMSKEDLERYFDFEAFGRDLSYDFYQTKNGYISE